MNVKHISFQPTQKAYFKKRLNRFVAVAELNGKSVLAHIATSGRLGELLLPGAEVLLEASTSTARRTPFSLLAVRYQDIWVSIDAQLPNRLMRQMLNANEFPPLADCRFIRSEPSYGQGRFDFLLEAPDNQPVYVEVKSVALVEEAIALFPDAPTERGTRHLHHLTSLCSEGNRCVVIFIVQRSDAAACTANSRTDPAFAEALAQAVDGGVEVYAYKCDVEPSGVTLTQRLPVLLQKLPKEEDL